METNEARFMRILHYTVEKFISTLNSYFSPDVLEVIDIQKVLCEIMKRSNTIMQQLRNITISMSAKTCLDDEEAYVHPVNELPELDNIYFKRIEDLVKNVFSQDLVEIALNGNGNFSVTDVELHNQLFSGAMRDCTSFTPSSVEMGGPFSRRPFSTFLESAPTSKKEVTQTSILNSFQLSSQLENAKMQFGDEVSEMRRITERGFSVSDIRKRNVATISRNENSDTTARMNVEHMQKHKTGHKGFDKHDFLSLLIEKGKLIDSDVKSVCNISFEESEGSDFRCWEDCMGRQYLHEHNYISEVTPEEAFNNISEKEYHAYSSLVNPAEAISEDIFVHDMLDVLIGLPSNTFFYDIHARKFRMKSDVHLPNLSSACTAMVAAKFMESGSTYYALQKFSRDFLHTNEGSVFKGMQHGVEQILSMYNEYIAAVKVNSPTMLVLRNDVMKNAELMLNFGDICGIDRGKMIIKRILDYKGLQLLSYLHDIARSHKRKENGVMIAVLLKYAYAPYFSFLNKWMSEGICTDPYDEFQIREDPVYVRRRDSLFWKFAYTGEMGGLPLELCDFSEDILDCGKSIKLLKFLDFFSLKFFSSKPPPSLSMLYSFPAVIHKVVECMDYIILKENEDSVPDLKISDVSVDEYYIKRQKVVDKKQMLELVKRRYNIIVASKAAKSNILSFKKVFHYLKKRQTNYSAAINFSESLSKCNNLLVSAAESKEIFKGRLFRNVGPLFSSSIEKCMDEHHFKALNFVPSCSEGIDDNFSGKLYHNIGLLFSSCGYVENDMKSDCLFRDTECNFPSPDFSKQLCLSSYSHYSFPAANNTYSKLPSPNMEFWSYFWHDSVIPNIKIITTSEVQFHGVSRSEGNFIQDMLSDPKLTRVLTARKNENFATTDGKNRNSFMDKLASLLVSEYGDSIDDIYSCIQVTSLQRLMVHNFQSVLKTRIHVVEKAIMKCIVKEYRLDSLLFSLRNIYFLQDEAFSQSLCEKLFSLAMECKTSREFVNKAVVNEVLESAISESDYKYNSFIFSLDVHIGCPSPNMRAEEGIDFLRLFIINVNVKWPLNIIVHQACIQQYLRIFSMLLEIEFLCWLLGQAWQHLIMTSKDLHLDNSAQFRVMMLCRFDMDQFIRVIRNSIHQHLQGPLWKVLVKHLSAERSSIDELEDIHMLYLEKVLARCFLTDETDELRQILSSMLRQIFRLIRAVFDCEWHKNIRTGRYEIYFFESWIEDFEIYKHSKKYFLKRITKESVTKKFGRYWDKGFQDFLETILEAEKFS